VAPDDCLFFSPLQIPLLPETVTRKWRFGVTGSVPVPPGGNNLQAHLIVNPSGLCPASSPCLPLPYLRYQDTPSAPSLVPCLVLYFCLPSPSWAYWDPGLPLKKKKKNHTMVPCDFLKLIPHLVCQGPLLKTALNQLLAPVKASCPNSTPTRGGGKTNSAVETPAIAKIIHRKAQHTPKDASHTWQQL
jgi:hypothetical protein